MCADPQQFPSSPLVASAFLTPSSVMHRCGAGIFKALSPHYLFLFFIRNGFSGWVALGGTLLCVTGSEALYADLGHFSKTAIRVSGIPLARKIAGPAMQHTIHCHMAEPDSSHAHKPVQTCPRGQSGMSTGACCMAHV